MDVNKEESGGGSHVAPKSKHNEVENFFPVSVDNFFDTAVILTVSTNALCSSLNPFHATLIALTCVAAALVFPTYLSDRF